jgi:hypothetical protein
VWSLKRRRRSSLGSFRINAMQISYSMTRDGEEVGWKGWMEVGVN